MSNPKNSEDKTYQSAVSDLQARTLLTGLITQKISLKLEFDSNTILITTTPNVSNKSIAAIINQQDTEKNFSKIKNIECYFTHNNEMYFFKTDVHFDNKNVNLELPQLFYKLQRRDNFRVYVPAQASQKLEIKKIPQGKITLKDISLGGCRIVISLKAESKNDIKIEDEFDLALDIMNFSKTVICKVKFVKKDDGKNEFTLGLQFEKLTANDNQNLQSAIFSLDRLNRQIKD